MTVISMNSNDLKVLLGIGKFHEQTWLHCRVL